MLRSAVQIRSSAPSRFARAAQGGFPIGRCTSVEGNTGPTDTAVPMMLFDLICRSCGGCAQRAWDPTEAVGVTRCSACDTGMSVIGIDFPHGREAATLTSVLEVIQGAGIVPVAVERHARGLLNRQAA
jgi:hypothetical protein